MHSETHALKSEHVGDEFVISVGRCTLDDEVPSEVLVLADAVITFGMAMGIAHALLLTGRFRPLWIVGIGYHGSTMPEMRPQRVRDFTPTAVAKHPGSGGAAAFLAFLREELSPWLEDRYGADTRNAAFYGHSLAGMFGAWVLLHEPATFSRYGLGSPSLWWDQGLIFRHEAEYAAAHDDLPARVLVSVGELETPAGELATIRRLPVEDQAQARAEAATDGVDMVVGARLFVEALHGRAYPSLKLELQIQPGESHATSAPMNLSRSMRYLWDVPA